MQEVSRKNKLVIALLIIMLLLPLFAASNWGLGIIENIALKHSSEEWAANLDLRVADFYGVTLRRDSRKEVCQRFLEKFPNHPRRSYAAYSIAECIERDPDDSPQNAKDAYNNFIEQYQTTEDPATQELVSQAERALRRLKN